MRNLAWTGDGWSNYLYWQKQDKKTLRRINNLIKDTLRQPFAGIGEPELLHRDLKGHWSREIDKFNRLVYIVDNTHITIVSCRYHYGK